MPELINFIVTYANPDHISPMPVLFEVIKQSSKWVSEIKEIMLYDYEKCEETLIADGVLSEFSVEMLTDSTIAFFYPSNFEENRALVSLQSNESCVVITLSVKLQEMINNPAEIDGLAKSLYKNIVPIQECLVIVGPELEIDCSPLSMSKNLEKILENEDLVIRAVASEAVQTKKFTIMADEEGVLVYKRIERASV